METAQLEYAVPFLATTGNTAPFIGLFGTVWGIMTSFRSIGAQGSANLAVVAPGISEALVATAVGLLVAIPAVVGYNHLISRDEPYSPRHRQLQLGPRKRHRKAADQIRNGCAGGL